MFASPRINGTQVNTAASIQGNTVFKYRKGVINIFAETLLGCSVGFH